MHRSYAVHAPALSLHEAAMMAAVDERKRPIPKERTLINGTPGARAMSARKCDPENSMKRHAGTASSEGVQRNRGMGQGAKLLARVQGRR